MAEVLLGVCGSAACFKAVALASALTQEGHGVQVIQTRAATRLVAPLQFRCVTGRPALTDEWNPADAGGMDHIRLARRAELFVVAPASAHTLARLAQGMGGDLLASTALAFDPARPRFFAPAMNPVMWAQAPVQRNVALLEGDGWRRLGPAEGPTACGEDGPGRMLEPEAILETLRPYLAPPC